MYNELKNVVSHKNIEEEKMMISIRQRNNSQMMAYLILADTHSDTKTVIKITIKITET